MAGNDDADDDIKSLIFSENNVQGQPLVIKIKDYRLKIQASECVERGGGIKKNIILNREREEGKRKNTGGYGEPIGKI